MAYVFFGRASGVAATPESTLAGADEEFAAFGRSVSSAGDINGDGFGDIVVGAPGADGFKGRAYVFLRSADGLVEPPIVRAGRDGEAMGGEFGSCVRGVGDMNGDGLADVVVGAANQAFHAGRAYAYAGTQGGLSTTEIVLEAPADGGFGAAIARSDVSAGCDRWRLRSLPACMQPVLLTRTARNAYQEG